MNFASDNCSGIAPEILSALAAANTGYHHSYGADGWTQRLEQQVSEVFEHEAAVFPVLTGGAANCLTLATLTVPYGVVYCHETAHINTDECGAPGFFTGGAKLDLLPGAHGKIDPVALARRLGATSANVHSSQPAMLSLTQATEWGAVYDTAHIRALAGIARTYHLPVHMDGARIANAIAALGCSPAEATWRAGVDVLSFGATKNGAMLAEAVIFFDKSLVRDFIYRRKQSGQLLSKMRFVSAQFEAYLADGLWLRLASHANVMAQKLAEGVQTCPYATLLAPVDCNELFVAMPPEKIAALRAAGADFYDWGHPEDSAIRLVTSFETTAEEVDRFGALLR